MSYSLTPLIHPQLETHERQRCEVWTRVMGYHRPMASFNIGKQGEFNERRYFDEPGHVVDAITGAAACGAELPVGQGMGLVTESVTGSVKVPALGQLIVQASQAELAPT
jgi:hypothetical protein